MRSEFFLRVFRDFTLNPQRQVSLVALLVMAVHACALREAATKRLEVFLLFTPPVVISLFVSFVIHKSIKPRQGESGKRGRAAGIHEKPKRWPRPGYRPIPKVNSRLSTTVVGVTVAAHALRRPSACPEGL